MTPEVYRTTFAPGVPREDVEASLLLAIWGTQSLHGEVQARLDAAHSLDPRGGCCWSVRIGFDDSKNCAGMNANTQSGTASRRVCLSTPQRLTINMTGYVETQNGGFEHAEARVNGQVVASGGSYEEGSGCTMREATASGFSDVSAGEHLIELSASTNDRLYHVGAFWEFHFTWEPLWHHPSSEGSHRLDQVRPGNCENVGR